MPINPYAFRHFIPAFIHPWKANSAAEEILLEVKTRIITEAAVEFTDRVMPNNTTYLYYILSLAATEFGIDAPELEERWTNRFLGENIAVADIPRAAFDYFKLKFEPLASGMQVIDFYVVLQQHFTLPRFVIYIYDNLAASINSLLEVPNQTDETRLTQVNALLDIFGTDESWDASFLAQFPQPEVIGSLLRRLEKSGHTYSHDATTFVIGNEMTALAFHDNHHSCIYVLNKTNNKTRSLYACIMNGDDIHLDDFFNSRKNALAFLNSIPKQARGKLIKSMVKPETLSALMTTKLHYHEIINMLEPGTVFFPEKREQLPPELKTDPTFTRLFWNNTSTPTLDEKQPTPTAQHPDKIKDFLESKDGEIYRDAVNKSLNELRQWIRENQVETKEENINRVETIMCHYSGSNSAANKVKYPLYRYGVHTLQGIILSLHKTDITPLEKQKFAIKELVDLHFGLCEPIINKNLSITKNKLSGKISDILIETKRELTSQLIAETFTLLQIMQNESLGYESHRETSVLNYIAPEIGLPLEEDEEYAFPLELNSKLVAVFDVIMPKLSETLSFNNIIHYLVENNFTMVQTLLSGINVENSTDRFADIEAFLDIFGKDEDFDCRQLVTLKNDDTMKTAPDEDIRQVITISVVARFMHSELINYRTINKALEISIYTPDPGTVTLDIERYADKMFVRDLRRLDGTPVTRRPILLFLRDITERNDMLNEITLLDLTLNRNTLTRDTLLELIKLLPDTIQTTLYPYLTLPLYTAAPTLLTALASDKIPKILRYEMILDALQNHKASVTPDVWRDNNFQKLLNEMTTFSTLKPRLKACIRSLSDLEILVPLSIFPIGSPIEIWMRPISIFLKFKSFVELLTAVDMNPTVFINRTVSSGHILKHLNTEEDKEILAYAIYVAMNKITSNKNHIDYETVKDKLPDISKTVVKSETDKKLLNTLLKAIKRNAFAFPPDIILSSISRLPKLQQEELADTLPLPPYEPSQNKLYLVYFTLCSLHKFIEFVNNKKNHGYFVEHYHYLPPDKKAYLQNKIKEEARVGTVKETLLILYQKSHILHTNEIVNDITLETLATLPETDALEIWNNPTLHLLINATKSDYDLYQFQKFLDRISTDYALKLANVTFSHDKLKPLILLAAAKKSFNSLDEVIAFCKTQPRALFEFVDPQQVAIHVNTLTDKEALSTALLATLNGYAEEKASDYSYFVNYLAHCSKKDDVNLLNQAGCIRLIDSIIVNYFSFIVDEHKKTNPEKWRDRSRIKSFDQTLDALKNDLYENLIQFTVDYDDILDLVNSTTLYGDRTAAVNAAVLYLNLSLDPDITHEDTIAHQKTTLSIINTIHEIISKLPLITKVLPKITNSQETHASNVVKTWHQLNTVMIPSETSLKPIKQFLQEAGVKEDPSPEFKLACDTFAQEGLSEDLLLICISHLPLPQQAKFADLMTPPTYQSAFYLTYLNSCSDNKFREALSIKKLTNEKNLGLLAHKIYRAISGEKKTIFLEEIKKTYGGTTPTDTLEIYLEKFKEVPRILHDLITHLIINTRLSDMKDVWNHPELKKQLRNSYFHDDSNELPHFFRQLSPDEAIELIHSGFDIGAFNVIVNTVISNKSFKNLDELIATCKDKKFDFFKLINPHNIVCHLYTPEDKQRLIDVMIATFQNNPELSQEFSLKGRNEYEEEIDKMIEQVHKEKLSDRSDITLHPQSMLFKNVITQVSEDKKHEPPQSGSSNTI